MANDIGTSRSLSYNQKQKSQKTNLAPHCIQAQRHEHRRHRSVQIVENVAAHEQNYCQSSFEISENASKFKTLIHPKHATLLQNKVRVNVMSLLISLFPFIFL